MRVISLIDEPLFVRLSRIARAALRFYDGRYISARVVQTIIGDAVPGFGVIAIDRNLEAYLSTVIQIPATDGIIVDRCRRAA